jgi:hypothetical protein
MTTTTSATSPLSVPYWTDSLSGLQARHPHFWIALGNLESRLLRERLAHVAIEKPLYIAGLARSGSTILLELLARHPQLASHRYRDFPPLFTPWSWNWFVDHAGARRQTPTERAHGDGIAVTAESPEAFEEVLWMAFFKHLHDPAHSAVLDAHTSNPAFEGTTSANCCCCAAASVIFPRPTTTSRAWPTCSSCSRTPDSSCRCATPPGTSPR